MDKIIMAGLALALAAEEERECVMHKEGGREGWLEGGKGGGGEMPMIMMETRRELPLLLNQKSVTMKSIFTAANFGFIHFVVYRVRSY